MHMCDSHLYDVGNSLCVLRCSGFVRCVHGRNSLLAFTQVAALYWTRLHHATCATWSTKI